MRGRAISLRWLEHKPVYDPWSAAHYTWISVLLLTVVIVVSTLAFKYRHTVCLPVCLHAYSVASMIYPPNLKLKS